jgi:4-amino-4-deoxy-L-arabinose transferase-like glycosyltransferase
MIGQLLRLLKKQPRLAWAIATCWVFLVAAIAFLWHLGSVGLIDETEPMFVESARQMAITGDWITPYFNDATRFDKPPLVYWLMAIGFKTIGINTWAARLPSALSAMALVGLLFYTMQQFGVLPLISKSLTKSSTFPTTDHPDQSDRDTQVNSLNSLDPETSNSNLPPTSSSIEQESDLDHDFDLSGGSEPESEAIATTSTATQQAEDTIRRQLQPWLSATIAATILALTPQVIVWARAGVSDMLLTACIGASMLCFFWAYAQKDRPKSQLRWYVAFYVFLALGTLDKGPVAIVLPGLAIIPFLLYVGNFRSVLRESRLILGTILYLLITVPWFAAVTWIHGSAYIDTFFGHHNISRFTSVVDNHAAPWYFYFLIVLGGFIPFSIYLPLAIARLKFWRRSFWQQQSRSQQLSLFAWFWFASVFIFFSISITKLPSYVLPLMPAAAILVGLLWSEVMIQPVAQHLKQLNFGTVENSGRSPAPTQIPAQNAPELNATIANPDNSPSSNNRIGLAISAIINILIFFALAWAGWQVANLIGQDSAAPDLQQVLQNSGAPMLSGMIWLVAAIAGVVILITRKWQHLPIVNILASLAFTIVVVSIALFVLDNQRQLPLRQLADVIKNQAQPQEEVVMLGLTKGSVNFYSDRRHIYFVEQPEEVDTVIDQIEAETNSTHNGKDSQRSRTFLLLTNDSELALSGLDIDQVEHEELATAGVYRLIRLPVAIPTN